MLVDRVGRVTLTRSDPLEMIQPAKSPGTNEFRTTRFHEKKILWFRTALYIN